MLKLLRKKGVMKRLIWVIAILIIISFGVLGTAYLITDIRQTISHAGKIFGKKISFEQWRETYEEVRVQNVIQYGDKFNQVRQHLDLDKETWDRLLMLKEADRRDITTSDAEVVDEIENYPFFQRNGQFDTLLYNDILRFVFRIRPPEFEESVRHNLQIEKLTDQVTSDISISEDELFEKYNDKHEKAQVSYALFSAKQYLPQAEFDQSKALAYYENNKDTFRVDDSINVDYVYLPFPVSPPQPPQEENGDTPLEEAMQTEQERETAATKAQADALYQALQENPDLTSFAENANLTVEKTGHFTMNQPNLSVGWSFQLLTQLFKEEQGFIPAPIETPEGIYIVQLADKRPSHIPPFENVVERVRGTVLRQAADEIAKKKAKEYRTIIKSKMDATMDDNFDDVVKELGLEVYQTPAFIRGQYLPKIGISGDFSDAAFGLADGKNLSDVVKTSAGYAILHLDNYTPADKTKFEEEKMMFQRELLAKERQEKISEFLTRLRIDSKMVDNIAKLREQQAENL